MAKRKPRKNLEGIPIKKLSIEEIMLKIKPSPNYGKYVAEQEAKEKHG